MLYDHENGLDEIDMYVEDTGSNAAGPRDGYDEGVYSDHRDY